MSKCYVARYGQMSSPTETMLPCSGQLVRAHLIPKQTIIREVIDPLWRRQWKEPGGLDKMRFRKSRMAMSIIWDPRVWVWVCGGPMGNGAHHGLLDHGRVYLPKTSLPAGLLDFAQEHQLTWWIERRYP